MRDPKHQYELNKKLLMNDKVLTYMKFHDSRINEKCHNEKRYDPHF